MKNTFTYTNKINSDIIDSLIITAIEGGTNYWAMFDISDAIKSIDRNDLYFSEYVSYIVLNTNTSVLVHDLEGDYWELNAESIQNGLNVMAEKYISHFTNVLTENFDAETADVFIQCCLFGEIVYG